MGSDTRPTDSYAIMVDELPFDCDMGVFIEALEAGVHQGRRFLDQLVENHDEKPGATYAGVILSPVASDFTEVLAVVNLGDSPLDRLVNGFGKIDWKLNNPGVDMDYAVFQAPWLIGLGQFRWGHASVYRHFPNGGSGLSQVNDRRTMEAIIDVMADSILDHMVKRALRRDDGSKWAGDNGPREDYTLILDEVANATFTQVD